MYEVEHISRTGQGGGVSNITEITKRINCENYFPAVARTVLADSRLLNLPHKPCVR